MRKKVICFFALTLCCFFVRAQYAVKNHLNLFPKKNTAITCVTQDNKGYLWLGGREGLLKFDGTGTRLFQQKDGLPTAKITAIGCENAGTVWFGTDNGCVYSLRHESMVDSLKFKTAPDNKITGFYFAGQRMFVSTYGNGIYVFENGTEKFHVTTESGLCDDVIYSITGINGRLWCGTDAGMAVIGNLDSDLTFQSVSSKNGLPDNIVRNISPAGPEKLLVCMQDSGVCCYDIRKNRFEYMVFFSNWDKGAVLNCVTGENRSLVFATEKNGLFIIKNGQLHSGEFAAGLKTTAFSQLFSDRFGTLWLTSDAGLHQIVEKRYDFINSDKGLPDEKILSVICDRDNTMWAGTAAGLLRISKTENNTFIFSPVPGFPDVTVSCSAVDSSGTLYFGTYEKGLVVYREGRMMIFNTSNSALSNDNISHLFFDRDTAYISTLGGGLLVGKIHNNNLQIFRNYSGKDGLKSEYVYTSVKHNGALYVCSDGGGLERLTGNGFVSLNKELKLNSGTLYSLAKDQKGNIWGVSSDDGVIRYDGRQLTYFKTTSGLRDEQPSQIAEYNGSMYLIHAKGIDKIDVLSGQVSYADVMEGDLEPNLNSVFIREGILYSATNNGILRYRIRSTASDRVKPAALITGLLINYKPASPDSSTKLEYHQNNLSIEFNGIWTRNPEKIMFRYQLKGYDGDWKYSGFAQMVNYNNLDAGNYTFVVQSKNDEDVWSDPEEFHFSISMPLWKRPWFWLCSALALSFAIYYLVRWRTKTLQKENLVLEEKVAQRTHEIEKQSEIIAAANKELEQLSIVASRTDNVVLILNPNGDIEYVNESFQKLNRISLDEILERKLNIFTSSNNPRIKDYVDEAISNRRSVKYESLNAKDPGNNVWEASTLTPIFDEKETLKKIIIIDSDITESKRQQKLIEQKNKDITDSIEYARKIQTAILPGRQKIHLSLPQSFVFYKTKDIVSGDFYWFTRKEDSCIIAAIDCTGHGVPGAFMSLIGYNILNKVVNENNVTTPGEILKNLNLGVIDALHGNRDSDSKDGMDAAICKIYFNENKIEYAGAMRPLWIVNSSGITEIKADKIPIGTRQEADQPEISYNTRVLNPKPDEVYYLFTDGFADQFGGDRGKKMGSARFKELLIRIHEMDFDRQEQILLEEHMNWKGDNEQVDDLCVIGFKRQISPSHPRL